MHLTDFLPAVWAAARRELSLPGSYQLLLHAAGRGLLLSVEEGRGPPSPQMHCTQGAGPLRKPQPEAIDLRYYKTWNALFRSCTFYFGKDAACSSD